MKTDAILKKLKLFSHKYIIGFAFIVIVLIGIAFALNSNRYYLVTQKDATYKIDKWTGKTWQLSDYGYIEIGNLSTEQARDKQQKQTTEQVVNRLKQLPEANRNATLNVIKERYPNAYKGIIKMMEEEKMPSNNFPIEYLTIQEAKAERIYKNQDQIKIQVRNNHTSITAKNIAIRISFLSDKAGTNEIDTKDVFFEDGSYSIAPQTTKQLTTYTFTPPIQNYWFNVSILSAQQ